MLGVVGNVPAVCVEPDCTKTRAPRYRRCAMHLSRKFRHGDPSINLRAHPPTCTVDDCDRPYEARGLCGMHYQRVTRGGKVRGPRVRSDPVERFWAKVEDSPSGCWLWTAALNKGYGAFNDGNGPGMRQAHRWAYEFLVGEIPAGLELDHLCNQPACVRPDHLDPVPGRVNRGRARSRRSDTGECKCSD